MTRCPLLEILANHSIFCFEKKQERQLTYDGHEGVKVADVEAFTSDVDEELDDSSAVLLLHWLSKKLETINDYCIILRH